MPLARYELDGRTWLPISVAARRLRTNALGVRKLMDDGTLEWRQTRVNSHILVVAEQAVLALLLARPGLQTKLSPDPLATKPKVKAVGRTRGDSRTAHHLRLTLPGPSEEERNDR